MDGSQEQEDPTVNWSEQETHHETTQERNTTNKKSRRPRKFWMIDFYNIELMIWKKEIKRVNEIIRAKSERQSTLQNKICKIESNKLNRYKLRSIEKYREEIDILQNQNSLLLEKIQLMTTQKISYLELKEKTWQKITQKN